MASKFTPSNFKKLQLKTYVDEFYDELIFVNLSLDYYRQFCPKNIEITTYNDNIKCIANLFAYFDPSLFTFDWMNINIESASQFNWLKILSNKAK